MSDNLTIRKTIRLNNEQVKNWNPTMVRLFLQNKRKCQTDSQTSNLLEKLYNLMSNKMEFTEKPNENDIELIKSVKEVIT